jgi:hypothetical protein
VTATHHPHLAAEALVRAAFGGQTAQILYVAAKLGIADRLQYNSASAAELAILLDVNSPALERIMRALVVLGVCDELNDRCFSLTPLGRYLCTDHPDSVVPRVLLNVEVHHAMWNDLLETVRTGTSASERVFGLSFYEHLTQNRAAGAVFDQAMSGGGWVRRRLRAILAAYDFARFSSIVDVGGGDGALMVELLDACPEARGIVFDLPRLAARAQETIARAGLTARCDFIAGDAFDSVPIGADGYILSNFANSFSDDAVLAVLRNCRRATCSNGRLLLFDWVLTTSSDAIDTFRAWDAATMDIVMLAAFGSRGGRIRTRAEFQSLLERAAFKLGAFIATPASICLIEAEPC